jgi:hypothetical protein
MSTKRKQRKHNPMAKALQNPLFRTRRTPKLTYKRRPRNQRRENVSEEGLPTVQ